MRISDWSSDGCSSDLHRGGANQRHVAIEDQHVAGKTVEASFGLLDRVPRSKLLVLHGDLYAMSGNSRLHLIPARADNHNFFRRRQGFDARSEEHTSELQSLMRISYAVFCLKKKTKTRTTSSRQKSNTTKKDDMIIQVGTDNNYMIYDKY